MGKRKEGEDKVGEGRRGREGGRSWNRAADGLRPALISVSSDHTAVLYA